MTDAFKTVVVTDTAILHEHKLSNEILNITKRELFAAMAMQGLCSSQFNPSYRNQDNIAKDSIQIADALITELNK